MVVGGGAPVVVVACGDVDVVVGGVAGVGVVAIDGVVVVVASFD